MHNHPIAYQLHQILVGTNNGDRHARLPRLAGVRCYDVVRLEAGHLDGGKIEGLAGLLHQRKLWPQVLRWWWPMRLIFGINVVAESLARRIEDHRKIIRLTAFAHIIHKLRKHIAETRNRTDRQPIALPR